MRRSLFLYFLCFLLPLLAFGQLVKPAAWTYSVSKDDIKAGETVELIFKAIVPTDWYMYSTDFDPELGPQVSTFDFIPHSSYQLIGGVKPVHPKRKYDSTFGGEVTIFIGKAEFRQKVRILKDNPVIKGEHFYQICSDIIGSCVPFTHDFSFKGLKVTGNAGIDTGPATGMIVPPGEDSAVTEINEPGEKIAGTKDSVSKSDEAVSSMPVEEEESAMEFIIIAFLAGLATLLTPCVFPIIPMTIAFFTKSESDRSKGLSKAFFYGFSIIGIFTFAGILVAVFVGPEFGNFLSTHWVPNVLFFLIFIIFGAAFLGMFEITIPSSIINKMDSKSEVGGYIGIFFMAFTLVLASFSCTGPIVSGLLIQAADGRYQRPVYGMLSYSSGIALPLMLLAIFPNWIKSLPKSGGWLNSVKVVLGFIEIALAFKFLSVADQVYHWRILDREINIAIWVVIALLTGFYLLGKLKFSHDTDIKYISVPRLFMSMGCFVFAVYLFPGMFGAPLTALSGYLPPMHTFDAFPNQGGTTVEDTQESEYGKIIHGDILDFPPGFKGFFDYKQALAYSKLKGKPLFIDFTGHGCTNCREMEARVWIVPEVRKKLNEDFIMVALYVDERRELPENEWYTSATDGKLKKTVAQQNTDLQITKFNYNAQPLYVITDGDGNAFGTIARERDAKKFAEFLDKGKKAYNKAHKKP